MSMLAERRRKTKWTVNPGRQALWNKTDSGGIKYGRELMEKMGWKVGQGLGVNEQGIREPLKVDIKNDSKGMGFKDNDNEWIQQQHEFNELLGKLSSTSNTLEKNVFDNLETEQIRTSLEEKSRHSKTRVHYHKFTRGKDLTQYSKKDLECILGTKKESSDGVIESQDTVDTCSNTESSSTITYAGSMVDYFKEKMEKRASSRSTKSLSSVGIGQDAMEHSNGLEDSEQNDNLKIERKKQKKEKKTKSWKTLVTSEIHDSICEGLPCVEKANDFKETQDDERQKRNSEKVHFNGEKTESIGCENIFGHNKPVLKKKKKEIEKEKEDEKNNLGFINQLENEEIDHWKTEKLNEGNNNNNNNNNNDCSDDAFRPRKKVKSKESENAIITDECIIFEEQRIKSKKKKRSKRESTMEEIEGKCEIPHIDVINLDCGAERKVKTHKSKKVKNNSKVEINDISVYEENCGKQECQKEDVGKENDKKENIKLPESASGKAESLNKERETLELFHCVGVDKFDGSNLWKLTGYGFGRRMKDNKTF